MFGDSTFRRVRNHRTHLSRMSSTSLRRKPSSGLEMPVEVGLFIFSNAYFEFADEGPEDAQHGILAKIFASHFHGFSKVTVGA